MINDKLKGEVVYNTENKICIKVGNKTVYYFKQTNKYKIINNESKEIDPVEVSAKKFKYDRSVKHMKQDYNKAMAEAEDIFKQYL